MTGFVWGKFKLDLTGKKESVMAHETVNGKPLMDKENEEHQQQQLQEHEQVKLQAEALALKLAQTYEELTRLLERNPGVKRQITEGAAREDKVYQKLKQRLKLAEMAPRCRWVRQDGTSCRSPQMKQHIYCFAHKQMAEARELMLRLPPPEDANAIQVGLMRIQKSLIEDTISTKKAGLLLYSMQLALTNVGQTTFGQAKDEEMVRETMDEEEAFNEEALSSQHSVVSEKQNQHQKQRPFTAEGAEDAKGNKQSQHQNQKAFTAEGTEEEKGLPGNQKLFTAKDAENAEQIGSSGDRDIWSSENQNLPRMDADERGLQGAENSRGSEFVSVPGGYGFERVRLRIEPSGHRANASAGHLTPSSATMARCGNPDNREIGTPPRSVPHADAEVHAVLG
jgi:hypothetical protein